jgi:hypothetical protein
MHADRQIGRNTGTARHHRPERVLRPVVSRAYAMIEPVTPVTARGAGE